MNAKYLKGNIMLLITAAIWGLAFVAQSVGMEYVGSFTFQGVRFLIGAAVLVPVILIRNALAKRAGKYSKMDKKEVSELLRGGLICGVLLGIASCLQQFGISMTTVGKASFLTTMYILIVPLFGLALGKKVPVHIWGCIALAVVGMYFLCMKENFTLQIGDTLVLLCSVMFAFQILAVDYYSPRVDGLSLSCLQFLVAGVASIIPALLFEAPSLQSILQAWLPIVYAGAFSCGIAYTLQVIAQKYTQPTVASLLMSLESVFATVFAIILLHQIPSLREGIGCILMFVSTLIAQLPISNRIGKSK